MTARNWTVQPDGCWTWNGITYKGYGVLCHDGRTYRAHRAMMEAVTGEPIPEGHHVHHECENTLCVNPAHLRILTPYEHAHHHAIKALHARRERFLTEGA